MSVCSIDYIHFILYKQRDFETLAKYSNKAKVFLIEEDDYDVYDRGEQYLQPNCKSVTKDLTINYFLSFNEFRQLMNVFNNI